MEHLPDDVLVTLMEYLDVEGLLACRLVCKRLGDLALHRDVWRHRQLPGNRCVCPVLRLAPRVASLSVELQHHHRCGLAYITTRCAVTRLTLSLRKDCDAMPAAAVIRRQEALGRLRSVQVDFGYILDVSYVLGTLATTADLEELQVTGLTYPAPPTAVAVPGIPVSTPSLRLFRCELLPQTEHFVNFILAGHAATLQRVDLGHWRYGRDSTGHLLGGLPNLRQLKCSSMPGLEAVAACESLQDLDLLVRTGWDSRADVLGAAQLLRRAKNLREVRLVYAPMLCIATQRGVGLLLDLAGPSCLEKLTVFNHNDSVPAFFPVQTLVSVLPSLSALVHLKVDADVRPDELLLAITPDVAPALQEVDVWLQTKTCAHAWIHGDTVKAVLSANPSLHLGLDIVTPTCRDRCCATCVLGCHVVLKEFETRGSWERLFYLFSHEPTVRCSRGHRNDDWIHVPV